MEDMGLVRVNISELDVVVDKVYYEGANVIAENVFGVVAVKVVEHVMYEGWFVEEIKKRRVTEMVVGWVDDGLRPFEIVRVLPDDVLVE